MCGGYPVEEVVCHYLKVTMKDEQSRSETNLLQIAALHLLPDPASIASGLNSSRAVLGAPPLALTSASGEFPIRLFSTDFFV